MKTLLEIFAEILGQQIGKGTEHTIYTSDKNPNAIVKVGKKENVEKWSKVFKANPDLFPKVFKVGKLEDGQYYAVIEKLDTKKAVEEWGKLEIALEDIGEVDTDVFESTIDQVFIDIILGKKDANQIYKKLSGDNQKLFKKWIEFLAKTAKYLIDTKFGGLDIHRYNFAYDKKGKIKAIDI